MQDLLLEAVWEMSLSLQGGVWLPAVSLAPWWEHSRGRRGLLLPSHLSGLSSAPPACHRRPQTPLSSGLLMLWLFPVSSSLLPVPLPLRGSLRGHTRPALGPPCPGLPQPFPAPQMEAGDCQHVSLRLPCLPPIPTPACPPPPTQGPVPGPQPPTRIRLLLLSPGAFLAASVAQICSDGLNSLGPRLPAGWREAGVARGQEAAYPGEMMRPRPPQPQPAPSSPKSTDSSFLSWCWLGKKGHGGCWVEGVGSSGMLTLCWPGGWPPPPLQLRSLTVSLYYE